MAEEVGTVVNKIEEIDSQIALLTQEKGRITSEYYVELLEHDVETISKVETVLDNLKTEKASELVEEYDVLGTIEEVIERLKAELKEAGFIKKQAEDNP